jgi:hypothetical protein
MDWGFGFFPSSIFPEWVANQVAIWALGSAAIGAVAYLLLKQRRARFAGGRIKEAALAILSVAAGYLALAGSDALLKTDFRFWVLGLRPLDGRHALYALAYLPLFAIAFLVMVRTLIANLATPAQSRIAQYSALILAPSLGFIILLVVQYASLRFTGLLLSPKEALNTIIAIQFAPILAFVGLTAAFTWRRTGGYVGGGLICALVITWYVVAGTATHWRPGWTLPHNAGLFPARPAASAPPRS